MEPAEFKAQERNVKRFMICQVFLPMAILAITAALIYNFRDYITPYVSSYHFCWNDTIVDASKWIFPKLVTHCQQIIHTELRFHSGAGITILIDIFVALCCIYNMIVFARFYFKLTPEYLMYSTIQLERKLRNLWLFWPFMLFGLAMILFSYYTIYVYSDLVKPGGFGLFHHHAVFYTDWGLGPMVLVAVWALGANYFTCGIAIALRTHFSGLRNTVRSDIEKYMDRSLYP